MADGHLSILAPRASSLLSLVALFLLFNLVRSDFSISEAPPYINSTTSFIEITLTFPEDVSALSQLDCTLKDNLSPTTITTTSFILPSITSPSSLGLVIPHVPGHSFTSLDLTCVFSAGSLLGQTSTVVSPSGSSACPRGCLTCAGPNLGCTSCPVGYALSGPTGDVTTYCAQIPVAVGTDDEGSDAEEDFLYFLMISAVAVVTFAFIGLIIAALSKCCKKKKPRVFHLQPVSEEDDLSSLQVINVPPSPRNATPMVRTLSRKSFKNYQAPAKSTPLPGTTTEVVAEEEENKPEEPERLPTPELSSLGSFSSLDGFGNDGP
eukprot:TRINITY_DN27615_c0_g1_i1.p1 TRINITY_DN27615_c0_g1~~TRINITY_DN27615_c0_g1_i1.p1  ORF type:complete len:321 (-),score=6.01 TRINITY_DN27615_c0_g1_i1:33-995(-)